MAGWKIHSAEFLASCGTVEQFLKETLSEIAIVGRSNVGKSSAINCLVNRQGLAKVGKTPGKTQTINRRCDPERCCSTKKRSND